MIMCGALVWSNVIHFYADWDLRQHNYQSICGLSLCRGKSWGSPVGGRYGNLFSGERHPAALWSGFLLCRQADCRFTIPISQEPNGTAVVTRTRAFLAQYLGS